MAGLFTAASAFGNTPGTLWTSGLPVALLLLLVVALSLYSRKLQRRSALLTDQQQMLQNFMQHSDDAIAILDQNLTPTYLNPYLTTSLSAQQQLPAELPLYLDQHSMDLLLPKLDLQSNWQGEAWLQTAENCRIALSVAITRQEQEPQSYLLIGRDISRLQLLQQETERGYIRDVQTGLLSPGLLSEYLQTCISFSTEKHPRFALLLLKFNQLLSPDSTKPVSFLHNRINQLSEQLQHMLNDGHILARYSNDTFAVVVPPHLCDGQSEINLNRLAHKLLALPELLEAADKKVSLQAMIGISIYPLDGKSPAELILSASNALQGAARMGQNNLQFANAGIQQRAPEYLTLETELQKAVLQGEFDVYYQPRISIGSNRVTGYEALLRWHSPKRGILLPQHFISMADDTGLI
ncbi:MAG TPA: EAL domain-containing protein, partial [Rheinheimera sp.]|nr:EAL domain-containing protein [Rheinheimera sp.]